MDGVHPSSGDSPTPRHRIGQGAGGTSCRVWPRALAETWTAAGVREAKADPCSLRARLARRCSIVGCGAPDRIRTCDLRLRRPTLYPLSYRRAMCVPIRSRPAGGARGSGAGRIIPRLDRGRAWRQDPGRRWNRTAVAPRADRPARSTTSEACPGNVEAAPEGAASNAVPVKGRPVTRSSSATLQGHLSRRLHRLP